jgi:2,3-bisphosphoglycerate-independent phosphoglycerate mutase
VGHLNIGAGRRVYMDLTRIDHAVETGEFEKNDALNLAVRTAREGKTLHIMGLLSPGGVHSHERHIHALISFAAKSGVKSIAVHAFTDGRDMPPQSAGESIDALENLLADVNRTYGAKVNVRIATVSGRFYAMDRDKRWDRTQRAYDAIAHARTQHREQSASAALAASYARGEFDEFVQPTVIGEGSPVREGDAVVLMNFRADRARQITEAFAFDDFAGFDRGARATLGAYVCLSFYGEAYAHLPTGFRNEIVVDGFGETVSKLGLKQLRIAETEKYAHVTYFFSGGKESPYEGETRTLVPSPKVETYDLKPEMSAPEVAARLSDAIRERAHDAYVCNFANGDMVGHTGNLSAATKAVEALDAALARVVAAARDTGTEVIITADHGNCEQMFDPQSGQAHTQHTTNKVPCIYVGRAGATLRAGGALSDIAPTLLTMMGAPIPAAMTGKTLVTLKK